MDNCFENVNMPTCIWFTTDDKRNVYASMLAGFLFFTGWWFLIDATSICGNILPGYHMCGVLGTISLIMVNSVSNAQLRGDYYDGGCLGSQGTKIWLFLGFLLGFASMIASCGILFKGFTKGCQWSGVAVVLQNALILISSMVYKFVRSEDI
nr:transmembrane protein 50A-like [Leptinotarsa decemlineata]